MVTWLFRHYKCGIGVPGLKLFVAGSLIACALAAGAQPTSPDLGGSAWTGESGAPSFTDPEMEKKDLEVAKLKAEVEKLRAEVENLRTLDPNSRMWTAWLAAGGTLVAAPATMVAGAIGWFITRAVKGTGEQKLQQERELGREQHNLAVFQSLINGSPAAATVLLERLRRLLQKKRLDEVERAEPSVIKNVLIAALKIEQLSSPDERTINTANNSDRTLSQASQDRPGAKQALCKYIADELVNTVPSGRFSEGERPANVDGKSPLGSDFQKCLLREVFWAGVDARGVDFYGSDLSGASLRGAALQRAKFYQAIMKGAVLEGADLTLANLGGAQLQGANLEGATLAFAKPPGADLTDAKLDGVDLCKAVYNDQALQKLPETKWPPNFPGSRGAKLMNGRAYRPEQIAVADISGQ